MQITIQVSTDAALALHQKGISNNNTQELLKTIETFGLTLKPMYSATNDPQLQSYFTIEVQDPEAAQRLTDHLRKLKTIKAAYVKPPDELP